MFNQIQKCTNIGTAIFHDNIKMAPVDRTALVIPFNVWRDFGLIKPSSESRDRDAYAEMEINFAYGGDSQTYEERLLWTKDECKPFSGVRRLQKSAPVNQLP